MPLTKKKLSKFIDHGRSAIESRMLGTVIRARANTEADDLEMAALYALYKQYNALMSPHELPRAEIAPEATPVITTADKEDTGATQ